MTHIDLDDAMVELAGLIDRALTGEQVIITRNGVPAAELRPCSSARPTSRTYEWLRSRRLARKGIDLTSVEIRGQLYGDAAV